MENYYNDGVINHRHLEKIINKTDNLEQLTIDDILFISSIHLTDIYNYESFILLLDNLYADLLQSRIDFEFFENLETNRNKIQIIINRFERSINNFYGLNDFGSLSDNVVTEVNEYYSLFIEILNGYIHTDKNKKSTIQFKKFVKVDQTFESYFINIEENQKIAFLTDLKNTFQTEIGIDIRILIELLKKQGFLIIPNRGFMEFIRKLQDFLNRNIGKFQSINDNMSWQRQDKSINTEKANPILKKLNPILTKYAKN